MESITCRKPGLLTTVQDLGRQAYQQYGVSSCGAMDLLSLRIANILAGNPENAAAIEVTLMGPELSFQGKGTIAICGGDLSPHLNGRPISMWKTININDGDIVNFGKFSSGCRAYIAISGGIDVPEVMGSKSTFLRGKYGGLEGRALKSGDQLLIGRSKLQPSRLNNRKLPDANIPNFQENKPVRFIWGPQHQQFTKESLQMFIQTSYKVTNQSDRMGYRLEGEQLYHKESADILSDYIAPGSIQVPSNGQPIILMSDCQMSGGYTKIGMIIGVDLPLIAQKKPGDSILFQPIEISEAQQEWIKQEKWLSILRKNNLT